MEMPFGKYYGTPVEDLPDYYLRWLYMGNIAQNDDLHHAIEEEWERRQYRRTYNPPPPWNQQYRPWTPPPPPPPPPWELSGLSEPQRELALRLIEKGFKALALEVHPDKGALRPRCKI